ncbi:hypothetical protein ELE98_36390, partial [Klebsiella pneumoniae]|nr:hypothetical protein [Klebsiella pneumoniae]
MPATMRPTPLRLEKSLPTSTLRWSIRNPCPRPRSGAVYPPGKEEVNMRRMVLALLLSSYLPSADAS